jgi:autotransporter-associated beta strand protein
VNSGSFWWIGANSAAYAPTLDIASGITVSLAFGQIAGALYYNNLTGAGSFTFDGGDANQIGYILGTNTLGGTLTAKRKFSFGNGGTGGAAGASTLAATSTGTIIFNSSSDNTYSGNMSGAGALIKTNANTLTLSGANTYSGTTTISGGTLAISDAGTLGVGNIINNGALLYGSSVGQTLSGSISGTGSLTKAGACTLTLSGYNAYTGPTRVNAGKLVGTTGGACLNSAVTVADGATNGVNTLAYGEWPCTSLSYLGGTATLDFDLSVLPVSTTLAPLKVNGDLNVTGLVNVVVRNGYWPTAGTYPLVSYTGILGGPGSFSLVSLPAGLSGTLVSNTGAKRLDLRVTAVPTASGAVGVWAHLISGNASGDWGTSANWSGDIPNATDAVADFSTLDLTATSYVNNEALRTVGSLRFADASASHDWHVTNSTLTLAASVALPTIIVSNRTATLYTGLAGTQGFIKDGAGTLKRAGGTNTTCGGPIVVGAGTLNITPGASLKNISGTITVLPGAVFDVFSSWDGTPMTNALYLSGTGSGKPGALHIESNLAVNGPITLLADTKLTYENQCTINGTITATGMGKNLELGQPGAYEPRYNLTVNGSINLGTGILTVSSVLTGGQVTGNTLILNSANSYSGGTVLTNYAVLKLLNAGALGSGGVTLYPTASLDLFGTSISIPWLKGTGGTISDTNATVGVTTLTVNQSVDTTYAGIIRDGPNRTLALVKNGTGSLALSGTNLYTGATAVSNGTLCVRGSLATASVTLSSGSGFAIGATGVVARASLAGTLTFNDSSRLLVDVQPPVADAVSASGNVVIGSGVELRLSGDQTHSGGQWKVVESTGGTVSGSFVLVGGLKNTKLIQTTNAVWLTIPPKGTLLRLL